jgi:hypothetical protein
MPRIRPTVTQVTDIGKEATEATAVASLTRLTRTEISLSPQITFDVLRRMGYRFASDAIPGKKFTQFAVRGKPAYDELAWLLDMLFYIVTPTTPGGATNARLRNYLPSSSREGTAMTTTIRQGDPWYADMCAGGFLAGLQINWDTDKLDLSGAGFGRAFQTDVQMTTNEVQTIVVDATSGTWTATVTNPETGVAATATGLAFDITAAALKTALDGLSNVEVGDVSVTGTTALTPGLAIEFRQAFGARGVATITTNAGGLSGGATTATVTTTTPGVAATETSGVVIESNHLKIYADTTSGGLGGTLLESVFSGSLQLNNFRGPVFSVNRANSGGMRGKVPLAVDGKLTLRLEAQDEAKQFFTEADSGGNSHWFIRIEAISPEEIDAGVNFYECTIDLACKLSAAPSAPSDEGGVYATDLTFDICHSSSWGYAVNWELQNAVATVS